jgi:organic radical activating enzyme
MKRLKKFALIQTPDWPTYDLKITLKPCFRCNHNCWFCGEYDNKTRMWTREDCDAVMQKLKTIPTNRKKIFFYFYGGEPTLSTHWEDLQYRIVDTFKDRELFIQTQTNMSLTTQRLRSFLHKISKVKQEHHTIDICSSYHLDKQPVKEFIEKMDICQEFGCLGLCFFSTELAKKEQTLAEFSSIAAKYPDKIKLRFTEVNDLVDKEKQRYKDLLDDEYLVGKDKGKSLEYRYWLREYPHLKQYFEQGWNFDVDGDTYNFSEVSGLNIHKQFKFMLCECGQKNIVIDHDLKVYHCNDDYYNRINITKLGDLNIENYLKQDVRCMNNACYDGLDFVKYR